MPWQPSYITTAELKSYLRIPDTEDDPELDFAITAASRGVDQVTNRQFGQVSSAEARVYTANFDRRRGRWIIEVDDFTGTPTINFDDDDDAVYDQPIDVFRRFPFNATERGGVFTKIIVDPDSTNRPSVAEGAVQVTALWGWTAVPDTVKEATLLQASRFFQRRNAPFGIAGSPEFGSELRLLQKMDPDVVVMLRPFQRWWGAA